MTAIGGSIYIIRLFAGVLFGICKFLAWISVLIYGIRWSWSCYKRNVLVYDEQLAIEIVTLVVSYIACYAASRFWYDLRREISELDKIDGGRFGKLTVA